MGYALKDKDVVVVGLGRSGVAAARLCALRGARVTATDTREAGALGTAVADLSALDVRLELGGHTESTLLAADLIVVSPGVPPLAVLAGASRDGVPVIGEVELAASFLEGKLVAITGTNGKSTVTSLVGAMLAATGRPVFVGGNLGTPLADAIGTPAAGPDGIVVCELSSFQLERTRWLRPHVALLINVTEDHLDRYPSFAAYAACKARIFLGQAAEDAAVVPGFDPVCQALALAGRAPVHYYGSPSGGPARADLPSRPAGTNGARRHEPVPEVVVEGDTIADLGSQARYPLALLNLKGLHNVENALGAILVARLAGADEASIRVGLETFQGLPHRMQLVGNVGGVAFYDDSKATNVGAACKAVEGVRERVILIAGGRDKGGDYAPLVRLCAQRARAVVLLGEARDKIASAIGGAVPTADARTIEDAVRLAASLAQPGDAVLLAPACSSYDMFRNFEERGHAFRRAVQALGDGAAPDAGEQAATG